MSILCWLVVAGTFKVVGKILLGGYMMRMVVSVEVTLAVPQRLRPRIVSVTQMLGYRSPASIPNICQRPINGQVRGVRLGCRRHRNNRLREKRASGIPIRATPCATATHVDNTSGAAIPISSEAAITIRRAMKRGSSPASIIRAK